MSQRTVRDVELKAPFALRVTQRKDGRAAVIYRRRPDAQGRDRLQRVATLNPLAYQAGLPLLRDATLNPLAYQAGLPLLRDAVRAERHNGALTPGPFLPLREAWGVRVACYALVAAGLQNGERLLRAAEHLRHADPDRAAWWLGLLTQKNNTRALRALRILIEAVE